MSLTNQEIINHISDQIAFYLLKVDVQNKADLFDINDRAEFFTIPLFKEIFGWNLKNLNTERKNYPGIDLADSERKIAIQVTSKTNLQKVTSTIKIFLDNEEYKKYDRLIICMIKKKQKNYSTQAISNECKDTLKFDTKKDIIDFRDLLPLIKTKSRDSLERILNHFQEETGFINQLGNEQTERNTRAYNIQINKHSEVINQALVDQITNITELISIDTADRLEDIKQAWREGKRKKVLNWIEEKKSSSIWESLSKSVKAKIMRFEAGLILDLFNDTTKAQISCDLAAELDPDFDDVRLRSIIIYYEHGPDGAEELLQDKKDIDSINLRAAYLLEQGRLDDCEKAITKDPFFKSNEPNTETYRLRALVHVFKGEIDLAQANIQKACSNEPSWISVKTSRAIVDYFSSISPIAIQSAETGWPVPIPIEMIKTDEESVTRLRNARKTFSELAKGSIKNERQYQNHKIWELACILNDQESEEGDSLIKTILAEHPREMRAIIWTIARHIKVDLKHSQNELESLFNKGQADIPDILALLSIYQESQEITKAIRLLKKTRKQFSIKGAEVLWYIWQTQFLIMQGNPEKAIRIIEKAPCQLELKSVKNDALIQMAKKTQNWEEIIKNLEKEYKTTKDPEILYEVCKLKAHTQDWGFIVENSEDVIQEIQTEEAVRLVVFAEYSFREYHSVITVLDQHKDLFLNGTLPDDLLNLRIICMKKVGIKSEDFEEIERVTLENPSAENLMALIDLCVSKGELHRITIHAKKAFELEGLPNHYYLRIARIVYLDNHLLAESLWKKAADNLSEDLIGEAIDLGYKLGLESEVLALMESKTFSGALEKEGIKLVKIDELKKMISMRQEHLSDMFDFYNKGTAPIHLVIEKINLPLSFFYHSALNSNENSPNPLNQLSLLFRHGGRRVAQKPVKRENALRLNLDITAILLAEHFNILEKIEGIYKPLRISAYTLPALLQMREKCTHRQPSRLKTARVIDRLIKNEKILIFLVPAGIENGEEKLINEVGQEWISIFHEAKENKGYLLDYLPKRNSLTGEPIEELPQGHDKILVDTRIILEALRQLGQISKKTYDENIKELGLTGFNLDDRELPGNGASIYCYGNTIVVLEKMKILEAACTQFKIYIDQREYQHILSELEANEVREEEATWLSRLIERINNGIDQENYCIITTPSNLDEAEIGNNLSLGCILTLMNCNYSEIDVIWVDDRFTNGFSRVDKTPIIGINEILFTLLENGELTPDEYYSVIHRMRASNMRFFPVLSDEILYLLQQAKVENEILIETHELKTLRRYYAGSLYQGKNLQHPPMKEEASNQYGEIEYLMSLHRETIEAIIKLNKIEEGDKSYILKGEWILHNLFIDHLGISTTVDWQRPNQNDLTLQAVSLSSFITQSIAYPSDEDNQERRREYLNWIYYRLIKPRTFSTTGLQQSIVEITKDSVFRNPEAVFTDMPKQVVVIFLRKYFSDLPEEIKKGIEDDKATADFLGLKPIIRFRDEEFDQEIFFNGIAQAINQGEAKIKILDEEREYLVQVIESKDETRLSITNLENGIRNDFQDDIFLLLSSEYSKRDDALQRNRDWFDCDYETQRQAIASISSKENPQSRIDLADKWRKTSPNYYYNVLQNRIIKRESIRVEDFCSIESKRLLDHLRLNQNVNEEETTRDTFNSSSIQLIDDVGIIEATQRYLNLPIPLPESLINEVSDLSTEKRNELIRQNLQFSNNPLVKTHLIRLLAEYSPDNRAYDRLARRYINDLCGTKEKDFYTYVLLLNWVYTKFNQRTDTETIPPPKRLLLTWYHGNKLFQIFKSLDVPNEWIRETFDPIGLPYVLNLFERDQHYYDVANPQQVSLSRFLTSGLQYCLGENAQEYVLNDAKEALRHQLFEEIEGIIGLNLSLIKDLSQPSNGIGSFLGDPIGGFVTMLYPEEDTDLLSKIKQKQVLLEACNSLLEDFRDPIGWVHIHALLGGLPPEGEVMDMLETIFTQTDFVQLLETDVSLGTVALQTATLQSRYIDNIELSQKLRTEIIGVAKAVEQIQKRTDTDSAGDQGSKSIINNIQALLLDFALALSVPSDNPVVEFRKIVTKLVDVNASIIPIARHVIQKMYQDLPVTQSKELSSLMLRLRAET